MAKKIQKLKPDTVLKNYWRSNERFADFMEKNGILQEEIGYIGDDLNDLPPMKLCGFVGCPADACEEVKAYADYVAEAD